MLKLFFLAMTARIVQMTAATLGKMLSGLFMSFFPGV